MELTYRLLVGDCRAQMATLPDASVDAIVTDPPYELGFMGKSWDASGIAYDGEVWRQALRVLKPGGHLLAFSGSRTYHRMVVAIEDAGFEIRDQIMWLYGSGFPKSHDVSKAIDREAGAVRDVISERPAYGIGGNGCLNGHADGATAKITAPATPEAARWQGWGTALKPAHEPICVARKPLRGTVAANVLAYGTGAINVDGCRVGTGNNLKRTRHQDSGVFGSEYQRLQGYRPNWNRETNNKMQSQGHDSGRWPANVIHDGSEEATAGLGDAERFFYSAKASKADRDEGMEAWEAQAVHRYGAGLGEGHDPNAPAINRNIHPTVKPTDLMRYLVRLVTPPGGTVLDPFTGSGSTGKAAILEGFRFIGCELSPQYAAIAEARIANAAQRMGLPHDAPASLPQPVQVRDDGLQQLTLGLGIG